MAKQGTRRESAPAPARSVRPGDRRAQLEACRARLRSVELLLPSSPRDALALARILLDDAVGLLAGLYLPEGARASADAETVLRMLPEASTGEHLAAARRRLADAEGMAARPVEGIVALRQVVADLARAVGGSEVTGLAAFRQGLRRTTWLQAGIGAVGVVAILATAVLVRAGRERHVAEFEALLAQGNERLAAGAHAEAVERFRHAIVALPDTERTAAAWNDMGWALFQLGRYEEAVAAFRKALVLQPMFPLARNNLDAAQRRLDLKPSGAARPPAGG